MGKQLSFFMAPEDENAFLLALNSFEPCALLLNTFRNPHDRILKNFPDVTKEPEAVNLSLVRITDLPHVQTRFIETQHIHSVDITNSPVVQFNRCRLMGQWLASGRIWFEEKSDKKIKDASFCRWANNILQWLRKNYKQRPDRLYLAAPVAIAKSAAGEFQLGPPENPIPVEERKRILGLT